MFKRSLLVTCIFSLILSHLYANPIEGIGEFKIGKTTIKDLRDIVFSSITQVSNNDIERYNDVVSKQIIPIELTYGIQNLNTDKISFDFVKDQLEFVDGYRFIIINKYEADDIKNLNVALIFKNDTLISFKAEVKYPPYDKIAEKHGAPNIYLDVKSTDCAKGSDSVKMHVWNNGRIRVCYVDDLYMSDDCHPVIESSVTAEDSVEMSSYNRIVEKRKLAHKQNRMPDRFGELVVGKTKIADLPAITHHPIVQMKNDREPEFLKNYESTSVPVEVKKGDDVLHGSDIVDYTYLVDGYRTVRIGSYKYNSDSLNGILLFHNNVLIYMEGNIPQHFLVATQQEFGIGIKGVMSTNWNCTVNNNRPGPVFYMWRNSKIDTQLIDAVIDDKDCTLHELYRLIIQDKAAYELFSTKSAATFR